METKNRAKGEWILDLHLSGGQKQLILPRNCWMCKKKKNQLIANDDISVLLPPSGQKDQQMRVYN